jgi:hypothetical protein
MITVQEAEQLCWEKAVQVKQTNTIFQHNERLRHPVDLQ